MEKRLQDFILCVQQMSDLRNLDVFNPIVLLLEHPLTAIRYSVVGAKIEPSYLGLPINVTWVVLDPSDPYYMMALKLKVSVDPDTVTNKPKVQGADAWWHVVRTYDEIFSDPQYYVGVDGVPGPVGPTGPAGSNVDPAAVMALLGQLSGTLTIKGPSSLQGGGSSQYTVELTETVVDSNGVVSMQTRQVFTPVYVRPIDAIPIGTTLIAYDGTIIAGTTEANAQVQLYAEYPSWTKVVQAYKNITIATSQLSLISLAINGASSIAEGSVATYTATATYSDGSTSQVAVNWSSNDSAVTIDSNGVATASDVSASTSVVITAELDGITTTLTITVTDIATVVSISIAGPNSVFENKTAQYTNLVTMSDGSTLSVTPTWSVDSGLASISAAGLLTAGTVTGADGVVTITATYGVVSSSKTVTITNKVASSISINGPSSVTGNTTTDYTATAVYNDGTTALVAVDWSVASNGSIAPVSGGFTGAFTANNVNGIAVIQATYTPADGNPVSASKNVTISMAADPGYPFYGTGPALPSDWQSFILGLPLRGLTATVNADFAIDALGANTYMYFCYPKSYGEAQFYDKQSQFYGGWGGGGNSGPGPNNDSIAASADKPFTTTITFNGVPTEFYVYRSEYANLGAASNNQWLVSPLP